MDAVDWIQLENYGPRPERTPSTVPWSQGPDGTNPADPPV